MIHALLIYPEYPDTFWGFKHALKFIHRKAALPPLGLLTVAAMLPADWKLKLIDLNAEKLDGRQLNKADYVLISAMNVQRKSALEVIQMQSERQENHCRRTAFYIRLCRLR